MAGFRILEDDEQPPTGGFRVLEDEAPAPIRFMEEPSGFEKMLAGVQMPKWMENIRGTAPVRVMEGMAAPMIGATQFAANLLPDSTGAPAAANKRIAELNADKQSQRAAMGSEGFDGWDMTGQVLSPANFLIAAKAPAAITAVRRVLQGGAIGAGTAAAQPVVNASDGFWGQKGEQITTGAATGAVLTPILGKVADSVIRRLKVGRNVNARASTSDVDSALGQALQEAGQGVDDIPPDQLAALRQQVTAALDNGQTIDAAAALRKADFDALGMPSTLGQITRDPMQFAREQNLRGVEGVGEPLMARLTAQGQQLQNRLPSGNAKPSFQAGEQLSGSLKKTDDTLRKHVSGLYGEARASAGKDLDVPLQGLAQDYADIVRRYGDENMPSAIRSRLASLGMDPAKPGNQTRLFTLEDANQFLQDINKLDPRHTNPSMSSAIGEVRSAVRRAVEGADPTGGPFAPAVRAAADRFKLHDAVPALKAAADGSVAPDDFVRRFVVNGKTNEVKGLAQVLKQADPDAYAEARAQLADELRRAAFGEVNGVTGDSPFSPARYMASIRRIGVDKLGAFFSPQEVQDIMRVGRVGTFIKSAPNASAVNTSNTAGALMNIASKLPGGGPVLALGNRAINAVQNNSAVRRSLAAEVPSSTAPLNDTQRNWLAYILGLGAAGVGGSAAGSVGQ